MKRVYLVIICLLLFSSTGSVENWGEILNSGRQDSRGCEICRVKNETVRMDITKLCPRESVVITTRVCVGMCHSYEYSNFNWEARVCRGDEFRIREFPCCDAKVIKIKEAVSCSCQQVQP